MQASARCRQSERLRSGPGTIVLDAQTAPISADLCRSVSRSRSEPTACGSRARRGVMQQLLFVLEHCCLKIAAYAPQPPIGAKGRDF
jgi:hypothetical protein